MTSAGAAALCTNHARVAFRVMIGRDARSFAQEMRIRAPERGMNGLGKKVPAGAGLRAGGTRSG